MEENHSKNNSLKTIFICLILIAIVIFEATTRQFSFPESIKFERNLQKNKTDGLLTFFKFISCMGDVYFYVPMIFIIFLLYPIQKSFLLLLTTGLVCMLGETLKNMNGNPRPFWIDTNLFAVCEGGYGNPSGHSIISGSVYLALWKTIFDDEYFENKKLYKYIGLLFSISMIILIIFSRIYLAAHSINQVIYGGSLGLGIYLILYWVFKLDKMNIKNFFDFFLEKMKIFIFFSLASVFLLIALIVYFFKENEYEPYVQILNKLCPELKDYRRFNESGLNGFLILFTLVGAFIGISFNLDQIFKKFDIYREIEESNKLYTLRTISKLESFNNWNKVNLKNKFFILLVSSFCSIGGLLMVFFPDLSLFLTFTFKTSLPFFLLGLGIWGFSVHICFYLKIANPEIDVDTVKNMILMNDLEYQNCEIVSHS